MLVLEAVCVVAKDDVFGVFDDLLLFPRAILPHSRGQQEVQTVIVEHEQRLHLPRFRYH